MENAVDALKMAFSVFVLMIAIAVAVSSFSMAKTASDVIMYSKDTTNFYDYYEETGKKEESRIVGIETIIPTLYRYYKENYKVEFYKWTGYNADTGTHSGSSKLYLIDTKNGDKRNYFSVDYEYEKHEPWTASENEIKKHLDAFLNGKSYRDVADNSVYVNYTNNSFIDKYSQKKFVETLKINRTLETDGSTKEERIIVYALIN